VLTDAKKMKVFRFDSMLLNKVRSFGPGVSRAAIVGGASLLASSVVPIGPVPLSLLLGAAVPASVVGADSKAGLAFCSSTVLRAGVVCVGFKMSLGELAALGVAGVPCVAASVGIGLWLIPRLAARAGLEPRLGQLLAVGTSICGVTAISALAPVIKARQEEVAVAVSNVVVWGAAGMICYPFVAHWMFEASATQIGLFLGLAVHDTSQVMGAAASYATTYGNAAVLKAAAVTKLTRNICLAGALPYLVWTRWRVLFANSLKIFSQAARCPSEPGAVAPALSFQSVVQGVPRFVVLFVVAAGARTAGDFVFAEVPVWAQMTSLVGDTAPKLLLGLAMAAVGLQISPRAIVKAGAKPFVVGGVAALLIATSGLTAAFLVGTFVQ
jgi:uncharacterized membrane protein YadS